MEDTLRENVNPCNIWLCRVLILVLMEDTRRASTLTVRQTSSCLNPCYNGRYSQRNIMTFTLTPNCCLNPCFNGRYSQSSFVNTTGDYVATLS